jgi:glycerol-3-phosphate dehydrogenase (NAD(P)+)
VGHRSVRAAVFSAGSWGTAVAKILADAGTDVIVHARRSEIADAINTTHRNPGYFPDVELPATLTATTDPATALDGAGAAIGTALGGAIGIGYATGQAVKSLSD